MDTITHGILGAATSQVIFGKRLPRTAALVGALSAMLPDIDVFIRSSTDPTVAWYYHRSFTHALVFIPIGALIAFLPFLYWREFRERKVLVYVSSIVAYTTHSLLDTATSYGTQLFWPFSDYRAALDWIGIIDPVYSVILLVGVITSFRQYNPNAAKYALMFSSLYMLFGIWQHHRASHIQDEIAERRGHQIERSRAIPMPLSLALWRSIYSYNGRLYVDGIRVPYAGAAQVSEGRATEIVMYRNQAKTSGVLRQLKIFDWFSDGYVAAVDNQGNILGDMRYSIGAESLTPLWGMEIDPTKDQANAWAPQFSIVKSAPGFLRDIIFSNDRYKVLR